MKDNPCPVCGYGLDRPASDCDICPSCGTQFGYSDSGRTHEQLRRLWIQRGTNWHSRAHPVPYGWNPELQLIEAGFGSDLPNYDTWKVYFSADAVITAEPKLAEGAPIPRMEEVISSMAA
jgi:hypothetical protein